MSTVASGESKVSNVVTNETKPSKKATHVVAGLEFCWDVEAGSAHIGDFDVVTFFRDSSLASLMSGFHAMVGSARFALAQQAEGQKGVVGDWAVISQLPTFEEGFAALSTYAGAAGWGRWQIVSIDRNKKEAIFRVRNSFEGAMQKAVGECWGSGFVGGKFAAFCSRVFGVNCWADQTKFIAKGDEFDEYLVHASERNLEIELAKLTETDEATRADLAVALKDLKRVSSERERVVQELQEKIELVQLQQIAIQTMSSPIIQVWEGILVVPIVGVIDTQRTRLMTEKLLNEIVRTQSRFAILDLTGVDHVDTGTANNFLRVLSAVRLMGARGAVAGINPAVADAIVSLGIELGNVATYANLKDALRACTAQLEDET